MDNNINFHKFPVQLIRVILLYNIGMKFGFEYVTLRIRKIIHLNNSLYSIICLLVSLNG